MITYFQNQNSKDQKPITAVADAVAAVVAVVIIVI